MTHEISHSIGRLGDEYDKKMQEKIFPTHRIRIRLNGIRCLGSVESE